MQSWIRDRLAAQGIEQAGAIEQPHVRWWSTVLRVPTTGGDLYFKALPPAHVFEAGLTEALARWAPDRVPELLPVDPKRGWMLMRDAARGCDVLVAPHLGRWEQVLSLYAQLQIDLAPRRTHSSASVSPISGSPTWPRISSGSSRSATSFSAARRR